ncbi:flagellar hook assembly protein FlgD [Ornithinibacillus xuwenensis]|uniref:Flagellar hook assembly protein FlgD n=1 Tax=Ornithinibacillus xuwenensis TaxID=3144668 RepID=A0ABU9XDV3_9BACI
MATIDPTLYLKNQSTTRTPSNDLGKEEFLKILMTQLQNQDPTNPMEDREFISQMAQFSSLEQMMNMSNAISSLVMNQQVSPVVQYSHMIGKEVSYQSFDKETGEKLDVKTSEVVAVSQYQGYAVLELENGEKVYADDILEVKATNDDASEVETPEEDTSEEDKSQA